jgi:hypothetical protein
LGVLILAVRIHPLLASACANSPVLPPIPVDAEAEAGVEAELDAEVLAGEMPMPSIAAKFCELRYSSIGPGGEMEKLGEGSLEPKWDDRRRLVSHPGSGFKYMSFEARSRIASERRRRIGREESA